ncbi:unnamed protein product, partial [Rotaria sp. Silwood2]
AVRNNLERQNRELREILEENEKFGKGKSRTMFGALEEKVHALKTDKASIRVNNMKQREEEMTQMKQCLYEDLRENKKKNLTYQ